MSSEGKKIFTSESVTEGHPDKICDQVSDAILDACLSEDKNSRVACECFAGKGFMLIGGEITTEANIDPDKIARDVIADIGYTKPELGFYAEDIAISCMLNHQSPDIAQGVDTGGAGDQGIMFGYACDETPELMPAPIQYAHALTKRLAEVRKTVYPDLLRPDGKSQVSVKYDRNGNVIGIDTILISTQHSEDADRDTLRDILLHEVVKHVIPSELLPGSELLINPTGRFVIGGPKGDTGLTGRKIIVDSYGGYSRHGGGCWSGKDPTKVDRSASYMARLLAKNIVASGVAHRCEVQLAYAIGIPEPVSVYVETENSFSTNRELEWLIKKEFDLTPSGIIKLLNLREVEYRKLAAYGHLGRTPDIAPWETTSYKNIFANL